MKLLILVLWLLSWVAQVCAQTPVLTGIYKEVVRGQPVTITFEYPADVRDKVKFFRVRKGQSAAGAYIAFGTVPATGSEFTFTPVGSCHVFVSAVWEETQPDGSIVIRETPGSNHVMVTVK